MRLRDGGELSELAPTALVLLGLDPPQQMPGKGLVADD
jgi:bisphosphoglycerate-independent phosphoglycerate mutase (AlkP superfamily)